MGARLRYAQGRAVLGNLAVRALLLFLLATAPAAAAQEGLLQSGQVQDEEPLAPEHAEPQDVDSEVPS